MTDAGGGWLAHVDPATGATYYARGSDVRWERPTEASQTPKWQSRVDPATGATYYYNESTRETSWTPPEVEEEEAGEWRTRRDDASGCDYYYHTVTGETSWTKPEERRLDEPEEEPRKLAPLPSPPASPPKSSPERTSPKIERRVSPQVIAHVPPPPIMKEPPARRSSTELDYRGPAPPTRTEPPARRPSLPVPPPPLPASPPSKRPSPPKLPVTRTSLDTTSSESESDNDSIALSTSVPALAQDYEGHDFPTFAKAHFQMHRKGLFKARTELDKICRWKRATMKLALLESCCRDADLLAEALQAHRNVTGYMGDRSSSKNKDGHRTKLIGQLLRCKQELRDEVYCQLVKQTTLNPSSECAIRGWELLLSVLATCPPSEQLAPHVGWHFGSSFVVNAGVGGLHAKCCQNTRRSVWSPYLK